MSYAFLFFITICLFATILLKGLFIPHALNKDVYHSDTSRNSSKVFTNPLLTATSKQQLVMKEISFLFLYESLLH